MANTEHVDILRQGVEVWNQWRKEHAECTPDLKGAYLGGAHLVGVCLSSARLTQANFNAAHLSGADLCSGDLGGASLRSTDLNSADLRSACLIGADLQGAYLRTADLSEARLDYANLSGADLRGAKFSGTTLRSAKFSGNDLSGAEFSGAYLYETIFANVGLQAITGLEKVKHEGPSSLDIRTLYLSQGNIPTVFLRGAGIPDTMIEYLHSLTGKAIDFYSCFISYSSKNQDFAERLYADLQSKEVRCWFAPEDLKIGDKLRPRIDESIRIHDKLLLVLSASSVTSQWVEQEVETALEREREEGRTVLFPIRVDNAIMETKGGWPAFIRKTRHIGDFTCWKQHDDYQKAFECLLRDLKADSTR